ncbi:E3 ubiquitin-protein transferase MAEA [Astathelohania contejeani]|uniref:E3 ubiquitin-protein transferase MAEA n=1 Tax=Astathelohania contejeani TaxID=164912 RepID=A0ABQ7I1W5_9MICR|nr:E3 ubiquitin-protein transferase MAEA [Thelohania contejeani]
MEFSLIQQNKKACIIKSTYKLIDKLMQLHTTNKIDKNTFITKLDRLEKVIDNACKEIEECDKIIELRSQNISDKNRLLWFIIEHLLYYKLFRTAEELINQCNTGLWYNKMGNIFTKHSLLFDYAVFNEIEKIQNEIMEANFNGALEFVKKYKSQLKSYGGRCELEETLHIQEYVELCKLDDPTMAAEYAQRTFEKQQERVKPFLPLLVCHEAKEVTMSREMNSYLKLRDAFGKAVLRVYQLPSTSRLVKRIEYGILALNTKRCGLYYNPECPTCQPFIRNLCNELPYSKKLNSIILCKGTGKETNNTKELNGYIYSQEYLDDIKNVHETRQCYFM